MAITFDAFGNIISTDPDSNDLGGTAGDGEYSYDKEYAARLSAQENNATSVGSNEMETLNESYAGQTVAGAAQKSSTSTVQKNVGNSPKPGTRLQNPLGNFSSYTYQLSLYMITPDAHTAFVANGRKDINSFAKAGGTGTGGAYLILQSGGVNTNLNARPPGMQYDYYIDDLRITNVVSTQQTATSSNITKITFNIVEPIGFSFITKLKRAREALIKSSSIKNIEKATNASKQFFVLGIRFQGYDKNGQIASASEHFSADTMNTSPDASGVYERFYDIMIEKISFKLGGGSTTYAVSAKNIAAEVGLHVARGTVDANLEIVAGTVGDALDGAGNGISSLFQIMNNNGVKSKGVSREIPDVYKVRWLGDGSDIIKNSTLKSPANPDKKVSAPSKANDSSQVNDRTSQLATYDKTKIKISITQGMSVLQAIQKIIKQSSYLEQALETLFMSEETPDEDTNSPEKKEKKTRIPLRWYNVSPDIKVIGYDTKINDFAYEITYVITPYETPAAVSPYGRTTKYYGPHKRYEYWYTGKNSEIISYEQQYDNTFFNITFNPDGDPAASGGNAQVAQLANKPTTEDRTGKITPGAEAQNSYMTSLFDPGAYASARIQILGDPDYLMRETAPGINEVYKQYYQDDGYTINPNGGQVFIEIAFNEGIDYNIGTGTMDINDSIFFWDYPDNVRSKVKGVSYQVRECESIFKGGKFTQTLQLNINTMPDAVDAAEKAAAERTTTQQTTQGASDVRTGSSQGGSSPTPGSNNNNASANSGLAQDDATGVDQAVQANAEADAELLRESRRGTVATASVPTGNANNTSVATDDSVTNSGTTQAGAANSYESGGRETNNTETANDSRTGSATVLGESGA